MTTLFDAPKVETNMSTATELVEHSAPTPAACIQQMIIDGRDPGPMMDVFDRWEARLAADAYGHALAAFQAECPQIQKTRQIDLGGGKGPLYASYDDIDHIVRPILAKHGLSKTFTANITETGQMRVVCKIRHGRHTEENEVSLPVPAQMRVNDTQKMGAALQYGKRYALCAALDLVVSDEDRDGAGLVVTISEEHIATLREWISSTSSDEKAFLKYLGVQSFAEISMGDYHKALTALKEKAKRK